MQNTIEYNKATAMYKVTIFHDTDSGSNISEAYFTRKNDAEIFISASQKAGNNAGLNKYTWYVQVEK